MIKHLEDVHFREVNITERTFNSMSEFQNWKEKVESDTFSSFTASTGAKVVNNVKYSYLSCQFDCRKKSHRKILEHGEPYRKNMEKMEEKSDPDRIILSR